MDKEMAVKEGYSLEKLKRERFEDDKRREKNKKFFRFFNRLVLIEMILGLLIALIIYLFFYKNLK